MQGSKKLYKQKVKQLAWFLSSAKLDISLLNNFEIILELHLHFSNSD